MFCANCGKELPDNVRFCSQCGAPVPEVAPAPEPPKAEPLQPAAPAQTVPPEPVSAEPDGVDTVLKEMNLGKKSGRLAGFLIGIVAAAVVFAVVLALQAGLPGGGGGKVEGSGFDSPEEAAEAYLDALKDGDLDAMLATFAMETYVEHYDLAANVEWRQMYLPVNMPLPVEGTLVQDLNLELRRQQVAADLRFQYLALMDPDSLILNKWGPGVRLENGERGQALVDALLSGDEDEILSSLQVGQSFPPERFWEMSDATQASLQKQVAALGADEIQSMALELTADGRDYLFCPDAIRYGDSWYLLNLQGQLAYALDGEYGLVPTDQISE